MYKNILFAVEFTHAESSVELNLRKLIEIFQAKIYLIHVVELPSVDIFPSVLNKEILYVDQARKQLADIGKRINVPTENQHVEIGHPKIIIPEFIKQHNIDLLITGHHERKGIYHLLGSTAYAILTHSQCAILILPYPGY